jgi:hypothetical protein
VKRIKEVGSKGIHVRNYFILLCFCKYELKKDGNGTLTAGETKYEGEFKNGKKDGHGTLTWWNGDKYVGNFQADAMEGSGNLTCNSGNIYEGQWLNNMVTHILPEELIVVCRGMERAR